MQQDFIPPSWLFLPLCAVVHSLLPLPTHAARLLTPAQVFPIATCSPSRPNAALPRLSSLGSFHRPLMHQQSPVYLHTFKLHALLCPLTLRATRGFSITANLLIRWKRTWDGFSAQQGQSNRPNVEQLHAFSTVCDNFSIHSVHKYRVISP